MRSLKTGLIFLAFICATLAACSKKTEDPFPTDMRQTVSTDAEFESMTTETDDLVISGLTMADVPGGRSSAVTDDRITGATLFFDSTSNRVSGSVVIDYGAGVTDSRGNTRAGKIQIAWTSGRWYKVGSHTTTNFLGYSINGVKFGDGNGATLHNVSSAASPLTWTVESFYNLTWVDLSGGNRAVHQTRQWVRAANPANDKFIIAQSRSAASAASGTNRYGKSYTSVITTPLEYSRSCIQSNKVLHPVKGVRTLTYDTNKAVTLDFGSGTCDMSFNATAGVTTRTITFKNDGAVD